MSSRDSLGDRIKNNYEDITRFYVPRKTNVIVRVDGRAFHTFTRKFKKPFDPMIIGVMVDAAKKTAKQISGFKVAYVQSDEASFLLNDLGDIDSQMWFDGNIQKIATITASSMTAFFGQHFRHDEKDHREEPYFNPPVFDARVFSIPLADEVLNYFLWRARDWERNSVAMLAQSLFSHKELDGKNITAQREMIKARGQDWDALEPQLRHGTFVFDKSEQYFKATFQDLKAKMGDLVVPHFERDGRKSEMKIPKIFSSSTSNPI